MASTVRLLSAFCLLVFVVGCTTVVRNHGHRLDPEELQRIRPGVSSEAEVAAILGTPSAQGSFDDRTWYYVNRRVEEETFYSRELTNQEVVRVRFDEIGVVTAVERFDVEDGRQVAFNEDATPTGGNELSVIEQFIGNIGRFNPPATSGN